ncbi:fumarylacetoacetate hydrolase family protein [Maritimibacter fusiformis]|uniref:Fumarylacetoacetate hydrolase family protein n=1 Tax=Maritimibacter fusiformis TaxID=2603819 RepID=A0A5D0RLK5_9RHOB|nr:fumarylacetoacetate hydrolase family protein [Maritimibacter fusiformis]TYB82520.1 fumarylacetoacetate hydrolase family protein [Maritimibacter fusiformis]
MNDFLFPPSATPAIPVEGGGLYPVNRIFCVGRNYAAHAAEMGTEAATDAPFYFTVTPAHMLLSGAVLPYPPGTGNFHYEMELALAIGKPVFRAAPEDAADAILGYCCALDMTRRDVQIQAREQQRPWDLGKDVEGGAVFAPLTRAGDFGAVASQRIHLAVNGEVRQDANLSELIHSPAAIVAHLSGFYHLAPGDMIMTGTPAGVGPVVAGDEITGGIEGLAPIALSIGAAE